MDGLYPLLYLFFIHAYLVGVMNVWAPDKLSRQIDQDSGVYTALIDSISVPVFYVGSAIFIIILIANDFDIEYILQVVL